MRNLRGTDDRRDDWVLVQQLGEGNMRHGDTLFFGQFSHALNHLFIGVPILVKGENWLRKSVNV
jgi:hypothetical protein